MIEYAIQDADGNEFSLNGDAVAAPARGSLTFLSDEFSFDNKVVERSGLPGSVKLGETRTMSRMISVEYDATGTTFADDLNERIRRFRDAAWLIDKTNERRVSIAVGGISAAYDPGGHKLSSRDTVIIEMLDPFWEDVTAQEETSALVIDINSINIVNSGYAPSPPIITLSASVAMSLVELYINETKQGIEIEDPLFGTSGYNEMVIDCKAGTVKLGTLDRSPYIGPGTGFFDLPEGASELRIVPNAVGSVVVTWRERVYV